MKNYLKVIPMFILLLVVSPHIKIQAFTDVNCQYQVHKQNIGWMPVNTEG